MAKPKVNQHTLANYRAGYSRLWQEMEIRPSRRRAVDNTVSRIIATKGRYKDVSAATGVPWWVIAIIHKMECDLNFEEHLHNGDSLKARTWQVPKGRPKKGKPPFTWEESAIDALQYDGLDKWSDWSIEGVAYCFEKFNGFGYRKIGIASPYLWSFSNEYVQGKFVRDNVYDPTEVSEQSGAMVLLKALMERDATVTPGATSVVLPPVNERERLPPARVQSIWGSRTLYGAFAAVWAFLTWLFGKASDVAGDIAEIATEVASASLDFYNGISGALVTLGMHWEWLGMAALAIGLSIVVGARINAHNTGKVG